MEPRARGQVRAASRMALPKNELAELYLDQRLSLHEIGRRVGISSQTVSHLAHEYGISLRKGRRPRTVIDRAWLYEQYVTRRRTLNDLARETGMNTANMNRWAHSLGIPIRGGGGPCHQKNLHAIDEAMAAPAILRPALQEKGGWQRLHRFAAVCCPCHHLGCRRHSRPQAKRSHTPDQTPRTRPRWPATDTCPPRSSNETHPVRCRGRGCHCTGEAVKQGNTG